MCPSINCEVKRGEMEEKEGEVARIKGRNALVKETKETNTRRDRDRDRDRRRSREEGGGGREGVLNR